MVTRTASIRPASGFLSTGGGETSLSLRRGVVGVGGLDAADLACTSDEFALRRA